MNSRISAIAVVAVLSATTMALAAPPDAASATQVSVAAPSASPPTVYGNCVTGTTVHFTGKITATGKTSVKYRWIRSDHATAPWKTLKFSHAGSTTVQTDWHLWLNYTGWEAIEISQPRHIISKHASFTVSCTKQTAAVSPTSYHGTCSPAKTFTFTGQISVRNGPINVQYWW